MRISDWSSDVCSSDLVAVLDEALAIMHAEPSRKFGTCDTRGIRDRNDDIDVMVRPVAQDLLGQLHAHAQARLVDVDIVDHRVRPCEIDVFEDAWRIDRIGGALPLVQLAVERDQYRLTGRDVVNEFVAERIERNRSEEHTSELQALM